VLETEGHGPAMNAELVVDYLAERGLVAARA
jgi:hypothetical protein